MNDLRSFFVLKRLFRKWHPEIVSISENGQGCLSEIRQSYDCGEKTAKKAKENKTMKSNNQINVPQAREAMDKFKMQAASEEDVSSTS